MPCYPALKAARKAGPQARLPNWTPHVSQKFPSPRKFWQMKKPMKRGAPRSWACHRLQQIDHAVGQALFAEQNVQLRRGGDLLEHFQFTQAHERRVVLEQLGRVNLAAHGGRFLAADD